MLPLFEWFEATATGSAIRESIWLFPVIEAIHLLGLSLLGGSLLFVDLRLLGWGLKDQSITRVARSARPWLIAALSVMLLTGWLMLLSEPIKLYYNRSFWVKITALPIALGFTLAVRGRALRDPELKTSTRSRVLGALSLALWFTVAAAGRWIGFS